MNQQRSTLYEDPRNRCCCSIHVQQGALVVAGVGIALSLLGIVVSVALARYYNIGVMGLAIALNLGVIYAHFAKAPLLFWPYLVVNGISIALCSLYLLLLAGMFVVMPAFWQRHLNEATSYRYQDTMNRLPRVVTAAMLFMVLLIQSVNIWFELVVYNAHCFMKRERYRENRGNNSSAYRL